MSSSLGNSLARLHGWFYVLTGFWPVVHIRSFEWVSGPKKDDWLIKTAGCLIGVIGATLVLAGRRADIPPEIPVLAAGTAVSLAAIDVTYVAKGTIRPIYLLDALGELGL